MCWPPPRDWRLAQAPLAERIAPWTPAAARAEFLARFDELAGGARG